LSWQPATIRLRRHHPLVPTKAAARRKLRSPNGARCARCFRTEIRSWPGDGGPTRRVGDTLSLTFEPDGGRLSNAQLDAGPFIGTPTGGLHRPKGVPPFASAPSRATRWRLGKSFSTSSNGRSRPRPGQSRAVQRECVPKAGLIATKHKRVSSDRRVGARLLAGHDSVRPVDAANRPCTLGEYVRIGTRFRRAWADGVDPRPVV